jgi:hypothetical protein
MEQREPSSVLEWPSRDRGRRSQRECLRDTVSFNKTKGFPTAKAKVLFNKSYGFVQQKLRFSSTKAKVLFSKSYGFVQQKWHSC